MQNDHISAIWLANLGTEQPTALSYFHFLSFILKQYIKVLHGDVYSYIYSKAPSNQ